MPLDRFAIGTVTGSPCTCGGGGMTCGGCTWPTTLYFTSFAGLHCTLTWVPARSWYSGSYTVSKTIAIINPSTCVLTTATGNLGVYLQLTCSGLIQTWYFLNIAGYYYVNSPVPAACTSFFTPSGTSVSAPGTVSCSLSKITGTLPASFFSCTPGCQSPDPGPFIITP